MGFLYIDPLKQGLKHNLKRSSALVYIVFIHRSIKTRIETPCKCSISWHRASVFIHRSIKTRIETEKNKISSISMFLFLYIDPLKQGLKHIFLHYKIECFNMFLYIDPLKQGLKPIINLTPHIVKLKFLYIDPLKQGLKHSIS